MERVEPDFMQRTSLREEHRHRYLIATQVATGDLVDCACGIGYGSEVLMAGGRVASYTGIDPDPQAIAYARKTFHRDDVRFRRGLLEKNSCAPSSVDTFVMFETLEHTNDPHVALTAVARTLKSDGLLIGSVPSAEYEALCETTYGPNEYHLQRFAADALMEELKRHFEDVALFSAEFVVGTLFKPVRDTSWRRSTLFDRDSQDDTVLGSLFFLAGSKHTLQAAKNRLDGQAQFHVAMAKANLDAEEVEPFRKALNFAELSIRSRDEAISSQGKMLEDRWEILVKTEQMLRGRDVTIELLEKQIGEQNSALTTTNAIHIEQRDLIQSLKTYIEAMQAHCALILVSMAAKESTLTNLTQRLAEEEARRMRASAECDSLRARIHDEAKRALTEQQALRALTEAEVTALRTSYESDAERLRIQAETERENLFASMERQAQIATAESDKLRDEVVELRELAASRSQQTGALQKDLDKALSAIAAAHSRTAAALLDVRHLQDQVNEARAALAARDEMLIAQTRLLARRKTLQSNRN